MNPLFFTRNDAAVFRSSSLRTTVALTSLCLSVSLAESYSTNFTLQAALELGEHNNAQLQAAYHHWKGLEANVAAQKSLPDPYVTYGYYLESIQTRTGPQNQRVGLSQTLPGFGKRSSKQSVAASRSAAAHQQYRQARLTLRRNIARQYAELFHLKRSTEIMHTRMQLMQELEQTARTRYKTGAPFAPVLQAQLELGRLEERRTALAALAEPQQAALNALLNRPATAPPVWPASIPYHPLNLEAEALREQLSQNSPELAELTHRTQQEKHELLLAQRQRRPDITLGLQYIETGHASSPASDSGKNPIIGTIGFNLPLWGEKNRARIKSAAHRQAAARLARAQREQSLAAEVQHTLFNLRDADRKLSLYQHNLIPKAEQAIEVSRKGYEAGNAEFINLIDAERLLLEFQLARARALADHLIARAELSKLTGIDVLTTPTNHEDIQNTKSTKKSNPSRRLPPVGFRANILKGSRHE